LIPSLSIHFLRDFYAHGDPAFGKLAERWFDGLRKAGMPEE
jgi:hypothetical protein